MRLELVPAEKSHLPLLLQMNRQLIEDEKARLLPENELSNRWVRWLENPNYRILLIQDAGENQNLGYIALQNSAAERIFLKHFFIRRDFRRRGIGTLAFQALREYLKGSEVLLEVTWGNSIGEAFWKKQGFEARSLIMVKDAES